MDTSCGRPDACGGKKGTNQSMSTPKAYEVVITTSHGLNIILTNKQEINFRSFAHFVTREDAAKFAETLAKVLAEGTYSELDRCPLCGQVFTRQNILSLLKDGRVVHGKCFWSAIRAGELTDDDCKMRRYHVFPKNAPTFNYSNIAYDIGGWGFRYAIQIVSKSAIHLHLTEPNRSIP